MMLGDHRNAHYRYRRIHTFGSPNFVSWIIMVFEIILWGRETETQMFFVYEDGRKHVELNGGVEIRSTRLYLKLCI